MLHLRLNDSTNYHLKIFLHSIYTCQQHILSPFLVDLTRGKVKAIFVFTLPDSGVDPRGVRVGPGPPDLGRKTFTRRQAVLTRIRPHDRTNQVFSLRPTL